MYLSMQWTGALRHTSGIIFTWPCSQAGPFCLARYSRTWRCHAWHESALEVDQGGMHESFRELQGTHRSMVLQNMLGSQSSPWHPQRPLVWDSQSCYLDGPRWILHTGLSWRFAPQLVGWWNLASLKAPCIRTGAAPRIGNFDGFEWLGFHTHRCTDPQGSTGHCDCSWISEYHFLGSKAPNSRPKPSKMDFWVTWVTCHSWIPWCCWDQIPGQQWAAWETRPLGVATSPRPCPWCRPAPRIPSRPAGHLDWSPHRSTWAGTTCREEAKELAVNGGDLSQWLDMIENWDFRSRCWMPHGRRWALHITLCN